MKKISCKEYVNIEKQNLKQHISTLNKKPKLCVVQIGENDASDRYVRNKKKDCEEIGIEYEHIHIKNYEDMSQEDIITILDTLNADFDVNGIIIQLPVPDKYNVEELQKYISPQKDVDGFRRDSCFEPCTPKGIVDWLKFNNYNFIGKDIVVLGRSKIVGRPLVNMLIDEGATVTCCNSHSSLHKYTQYADVVISAIGQPRKLGYTYFRDVKIIVDVGINQDSNGKLCGDIDTEYFVERLPRTYITPVPGGVGLITRLALMKNVVAAYELQNKK